MGVDWSHPHEASQQHHQAGTDLESAGEEREGKTQEPMVQIQQDRHAEKRSLLVGAGEDSSESGVMPECRPRPMVLMG